MLKEIKIVETLANSSKVKRLLHHPIKYCFAILHRRLWYPFFKRNKIVQTTTFFHTKMQIRLPASTDIYLTGGKTHSSELRLAKFLIHHLKNGDCFLDIGAHYGYFTLLGAKLVGNKGSVLSFEAAPTTYELLKKNAAPWQNITPLNYAVSNEVTTIPFFEFPALYSEYNSMNIKQFEEENWFKKYPPKKQEIETLILTSFLKEKDYQPSIIKIDVEGAEDKVIEGSIGFLEKNSPIIVMEYLSSKRGNQPHRKAAQLLKDTNYESYIIGKDGQLILKQQLDTYLIKNQLDSDNIVFCKKNRFSPE